MRIRIAGVSVLLLGILLLASCAHLPEYARPRRIPSGETHKGTGPVFTYRPLKVEDFRAPSLPGDLSKHEKTIHAQAVTSIRITPDSKFTVSGCPVLDRVNYCGRIDRLAFEAVMVPDGSWWNPKLRGEMTSYVLQHEQIHFAITELAARKLTADARKWAPDFTVVRQTPQEVIDEITRRVKSIIESGMSASQKRHEKFDEDTSLFHSPAWQAWWLETVEKELKQTGSGKRGE